MKRSGQAEDAEKNWSGRSVALHPKSPPFAKFAKDGAPFEAQGNPSSSNCFVAFQRSQEHRKECLCHKMG